MRHYVTSNSELDAIFAQCSEFGICGLDTETYTTDPSNEDGALDPYYNAIRLIQIATPNDSYILDLHKVTDKEKIRHFLLDPTIVKVGHNLIFENVNFLHHFDCWVENGFDTLLASRLLEIFVKKNNGFYPKNYNPEDRKHNLLVVAKRYLGLALNKDEQVSDWSRPELTEDQIRYAFVDAEVMLPLHKELSKRLTALGMNQAAKIEFAAVPAIAEMELVGWGFDASIVEDIEREINTRVINLNRYLGEEFPSKQRGLFETCTINLDSPQQLKAAFQGKYGVELDSTDKRALLAWRAENDEVICNEIARRKGIEPPSANFSDFINEHHSAYNKIKYRLKGSDKVVDALVNYSSLQNMLSTCQELKDGIHPKTKRIHSGLIQLGQQQHRMAVRTPNWLKIPRPNSFGHAAKLEDFKYEKNFRQAFIPTEGYKFSICDFAQNQLRIIADQANEYKMVAEFNKGDKADLYRATAAAILKKPLDQVTKNERQDAKVWVLSFSFAVGAHVYMKQKLEDTREYTPLEFCKAERNAFFDLYTGLRPWHKAQVEQVKKYNFIYTPTGRKIYFHPECDIYTEAINFPICATEVDGAKLALARIFRKIKKEKLRAKLVGFVYDEIVIESHPDDIPAVRKLHEELMLDSMQKMLKRVPSMVELNVGDNWSAK